ncbi:MAG: alkaline phosphatase family protein [Phycisphaerales bacterium]|nr:alkaline phosphatase family protein [Phycisphaerales bacterium]
MRAMTWRVVSFVGALGLAAGCLAIDRKVLVIGIDGMRPDARAVANTPNMDGLITNGAHSAECMVEDITISGPCWSSMFCGVHRNKHGVTGNSFAGSNYTQYPHFFKRLEELCDIQTASFVNWSPLNTTILQNQADVIHTGGPDTLVASQAVSHIQGADPDVVIVAFDEVDGSGHANGFSPTVPAYVAKIEATDALVGQVLAAVRARPTYLNEDWLVIVTSDHGGTPDGSHGRNIPEHRLVDFIVSGASTAQGTAIVPAPEIVDLPATVFTFLGLTIPPAWGWDGVARGLSMSSSPSVPFVCVPPPPPPTGACCGRTGACTILTVVACTEQRGVWAGLATVCSATPCVAPVVAFTENFNAVALGASVDETPAGTNVWSPTPPAGWSVDRSGVPSGGVTEWRGWSFTSPPWWSTVAGDQNRSQFAKGSGAIAVADPDEWDDLARSAGTYNSMMSTPAIPLAGLRLSTLKLMLDSSWRPEQNQTATITARFNTGTPVELLRWTSTPGPTFKGDATNETLVLDVPAPAGATSVVFDFAMTDAENNWWWAVDNIELIGEPLITRRVLLNENFEQVVLGPNVNETIADTQVWSETPPTGWLLDDSGVPTVGIPASGVKEWEGWAFTSRAWWVQVAGDQNRSQFTKGVGTIAVADPDEWDDRGTPAPNMLGAYNARMLTPTIEYHGVSPGSMIVQFDSSWRFEGQQQARLRASFDGAAPVTLLQWDSAAGPTFKPDATNETVSLNVSNPAGATSVRFTFELLNARNNWWWAIDNLSVSVQNAACATDHNNSGSVDVTDIFAFLNDWFAGDADFNRDAQNTLQDIFDFLNAWFAGC